jgi:hypothetical protein
MEERQGLLLLTNHRLLFEGRMSEGLMTQALRGPRMATMLDVPLRQVSNAHVDRRPIGRPCLRVGLQGHGHTFRVGGAAAWYIAIAAAKQQPASGTPWGGPPAPVVVQIQSPPPLPAPLPPLVRLRCP